MYILYNAKSQEYQVYLCILYNAKNQEYQVYLCILYNAKSQEYQVYHCIYCIMLMLKNIKYIYVYIL